MERVTAPAWDAFLKTLEEPPPHTVFVMATTSAHRIPATIVSRCQRFDLGRIGQMEITQHLEIVARREGIRLKSGVAERLARLARGGMRGGDLSGGQQQQLAIGRALVMRPRLLLLDEPTEGIQPSIIKDIGRAISYLRNLGQIAVVLVEQYLDFARELGDHFAVMDRGAIVYSCTRDTMDEAALKRAMAI